MVRKSYISLKTDANEDDNDGMKRSSHGALQAVRYSVTNGNFRIVLRKKPKIIRYVKYNQKVDSENYFREQLLLFYPWRNEEKDLLNGHEHLRDALQSCA